MRGGSSFRTIGIGDIVLFWLPNQIEPLPLVVVTVHPNSTMVMGTIIGIGQVMAANKGHLIEYNPGQPNCWGFKDDYPNQGDLKV